MRAQHDGSLFLDDDLDLFRPIAEKQPLFAAWQRYSLEEEQVRSPDGSTKQLLWKQVRQELLQPLDATNAAAQDH